MRRDFKASRRAGKPGTNSKILQREVTLINRQRQVRLPVSRLRAFLSRLDGLLDLDRGAFSVCFVNDREMRKFNRRYRGQDRPTDVLSFPANDEPAGTTRDLQRAPEWDYAGDILISAETARRQARREGHGFEKEICLLMLHGLLHLSGMDHERDQGEMARTEYRLRERLGLEGSQGSLPMAGKR
jgi:probable rRNA maturation factor